MEIKRTAENFPKIEDSIRVFSYLAFAIRGLREIPL